MQMVLFPWPPSFRLAHCVDNMPTPRANMQIADRVYLWQTVSKGCGRRRGAGT